MKRYSLLLFGILVSLNSLAQRDNTTSKKEEEKFIVVDKIASFPGGIQEYFNYIAANYQYPKLAKDSGIEGRVYVQFIITDKGKITEPRVVQGIGYGCDKEALRLISEMPDWIPAKSKGRAVKQKMIQNILFKDFEAIRSSKSKKKKRGKKN